MMRMGDRITVFLADDNVIVREGVRALLGIEPDLEVVGTAGDYDELIAGASEAAAQVLVTDIRMPPAFQREGIDAAKELRKRHPGNHAWNGERRSAQHIAIVLHQRPGEEVGRLAFPGERIVGRVELARRTHAVVHGVRCGVAGAPDLHAAARGESAHPGLDHANGEGGGDGRVDRVAARFEHCSADLGRASVLCRHHAAARRHDGLADDLRVREVIQGPP